MTKGTRDYAKHSNAIKKRPVSKDPSRSTLVVLSLTVCMLGVFIAALFHLKVTSKSSSHPSVVSKKSHTKPIHPVVNKPRFEFYSILPKSDPGNEIGENETKEVKTSSEEVKNTEPAPIATKKYMLQVAAFKKNSDADRLKAQLTLLGYNAQIQTFDNHGSIWNRVNLGPYPTLAKAEEEQKKLKHYHFNSILKRG